VKKKSILVSVAGLLSVSLLGVTPVAAAPVAKGTPPKPIISLIRYSPAAKGKVNITFVIAAIDAKYKTTSTEISIAYYDKSCVIKGKAKSCTVKNFGKDIYAGATARSKNSKGFGAWSQKLMFNVGVATYIRRGYNSKGVKFPSPISMTKKSRVLGTSGKWTKFQPLRRKSVGTSGLRQAKVPSDVPSSMVIFQVSGIAGLAQSSSSNSTCNSVAPGSVPLNTCTFGVGLDGSSPSIFAPGSATPSVRDFYSAPNNNFYVVFASPTPLVADGARCVLAEVNTESGIPTCVDSELTMVTMGLGFMFGPAGANGNAPIQFDDAGNIYYTGQSVGYSFTLRKNVNGVITPLVRDNVMVRDFVVLGDGSVIMSGQTQSTQAWWIRKVSAGTGAITNLANGTQATFLRKFVDKNIYFGVPNTQSGMGGVSRYSVDQGKTDALSWIAGSYPPGIKSQNDISGVCSLSSNGPFCGSAGAYVREIFNIGTDRTMAIAGSQGGSGATELMQYYPTVERANTVITSITVWYQIGNKLLLAGTDKDSKNILSLYDPQTFQETILLDASNEIEIYNLGYVASANKIMFNGLSFSDGQYVVGDIPL
jgi:hypothetical protein